MQVPYRTCRRVEFRDTDAAGIMHFSTYFTYMEEVEHEFLRSLGTSVDLPLEASVAETSEENHGPIGRQDQLATRGSAVPVQRLGTI